MIFQESKKINDDKIHYAEWCKNAWSVSNQESLTLSCCPSSIGWILWCLRLSPLNYRQWDIVTKNIFYVITLQALEAIDEVGDILQLKYSKQKHKK